MMRYPLLTLSLVVPLSAALAQAKRHAATPQPTVTIAMPDKLTWGPAPAMLPAGANVAVPEGDPTKPAAFTMRLRMPDGFQIPPHFHPATEHVSCPTCAENRSGRGSRGNGSFGWRKATSRVVNTRSYLRAWNQSHSATSGTRLERKRSGHEE